MSAFSLGIDLGGTKTEIIALNCKGEEVFRKRVATVKGSYADTKKTIASLVQEAEVFIGQTAPLGIAIPGTVSIKTGKIKNANSYWLNGQDLKGDLAQILSKNEIYIENDANCFALSEATDGAGSFGKVVWGIILGTGSGSSIVVNKSTLLGRNSLSGEWGHNPLPWMNEVERAFSERIECFCGQKGCIETFVSGTGFELLYKELTGIRITGKEIVTKARAGDDKALETLGLYKDRLARAIACYANFLDPDVIVLGGGMSNVEEIYDDIGARCGQYIFGHEFDTKIVKAKFGDSSGVRGAAWLPNMHQKLSCEDIG